MLKHRKSYFTIEEVRKRWEASHEDMRYYIREQQLEFCVWTIGIEVRGPASSSPPQMINGLQSVLGEDLWAVLQNGAHHIHRFRCAEGELVRTSQEPALVVRYDDLLITRLERDRFELQCGFFAPADEAAASASFNPLDTFSHDRTYARVSIGNTKFTLGSVQASAVKLLHEAAASGDPWLHQNVLLGASKAKYPRMVDAFADKEKLHALFEGDNRGNFRLNLPLRPTTSLRRSAFASRLTYRYSGARVERASHPSHYGSH